MHFDHCRTITAKIIPKAILTACSLKLEITMSGPQYERRINAYNFLAVFTTAYLSWTKTKRMSCSHERTSGGEGSFWRLWSRIPELPVIYWLCSYARPHFRIFFQRILQLRKNKTQRIIGVFGAGETETKPRDLSWVELLPQCATNSSSLRITTKRRTWNYHRGNNWRYWR